MRQGLSAKDAEENEEDIVSSKITTRVGAHKIHETHLTVGICLRSSSNGLVHLGDAVGASEKEVRVTYTIQYEDRAVVSRQSSLDCLTFLRKPLFG